MLRNALHRWSAILFLAAFLTLAGGVVPLRGQDGCRAPLPKALGREPNIFSEQQETDLGDAIAEKMARTYRISTDERFISYLEQIADRLLKFMPATNLHVKISLVDLPNANAFDVAGGRVYIALKIVAMARNEDELAGVMAHEFGHMVVHQGAVDMSWYFRHWLKVTEVSDRRDVYDKFNQLIDTAWHKPLDPTPADAAEKEIEKQENEMVADRLAIYALAGAGYSVEAFPEIFDRVAETKGKKGNGLTDFLGGGNPESKRLREGVKTAERIPERCIGGLPQPNPEAFKAWQRDVIENLDWNNQELLHGVLSKTPLTPPLRGEIRHLKFSPDGNYILAQDKGNIYVLSRQPFQTLFQISARDAAPAQFTPDSKALVFHTYRQHVETWSIAARKRTAVHELVVQEGCLQSDLSPDGRILACGEGGKHMVLFDTASGKELFRKPYFIQNLFGGGFATIALEQGLSEQLHIDVVPERFSPDGSYFVAACGGAGCWASLADNLLVDLKTDKAVTPAIALRRHLNASFTFLGPDRILAVSARDPAKSVVMEFPSGKVVNELAVGKAHVAAATHGTYVMLRPVEDYEVGVIDPMTGKHFFASKKSALDIYDNVGVAEARDGELALFDIGSSQRLALASLAQGRLGALKADALSSDWKWLAASEEERGAVWNLENGKALYNTRGFEGAYFSDDGSVYANFPKYKEKEREIARLSLAAPQVTDGIRITEEHAQQFGKYLLLVRPEEKSPWNASGVNAISPLGRNPLFEKVTWEVDDVRTGAKLWSQYFPQDAPTMTVDPRENMMLLSLDASSNAARVDMKQFPFPGERPPSRKEKATSFLVGVMDPYSGKPIGSIVVNTGAPYMSLQGAHASHRWVALADRNNRILVYSLASGEEIGRFFGAHAAFSSATDLISIENEDGHVTLYDINTGQDLDRWVFSSPIVMIEFSADGKRLFALTADQIAYVLDVSRYASAGIAGAPAATQTSAPAQ